MRETIPDFLIEQAALGELSDTELEALRSECDLEARIAVLEASNREILEAYSPAEMADRIRIRAQREEAASAGAGESGTRIVKGLFRVALPLAAAAALFIAVGLPDLQDRQVPGSDAAFGVRLKGLKPAMHIYRRSGDEVLRLEDRQQVRENDLLQISYIAAGSSYGVILSIDGRGTITLHHPDRPEGDQHLEPDGEYALPFSYQLDDAPDFERFYFISGSEEIPMKLVLDEAERVAASRTGTWIDAFRIPDTFTQESILLIKEKQQ
jgi:hypothetical protein